MSKQANREALICLRERRTGQPYDHPGRIVSDFPPVAVNKGKPRGERVEDWEAQRIERLKGIQWPEC